MLKSFIAVLMFSGLAAAAQSTGAADSKVAAFKKEMPQLQTAADAAVSASESIIMSPSKATYLDGYGVVLSLQVSFLKPMGPFGSSESPAQARTLIEQREKALKMKLYDFIKDRVAKSDSIGGAESLAVIVYILNANPAAVELPMQLVLSVKKSAPSQVTIREL